MKCLGGRVSIIGNSVPLSLLDSKTHSKLEEKFDTNKTFGLTLLWRLV